MIKKITSVCSAVLSVVIIIVGIVVYNDSHHTYWYSGKYRAEESDGYSYDYDVKGASFGADFYTYIYGASDTIVDELETSLNLQQDIIDNQKEIIDNVDRLGKAVANVADDVCNELIDLFGLLIISIGISTLAFSLISIGKSFSPETGVEAKENFEHQTTENAAEQPQDEVISEQPINETAEVSTEEMVTVSEETDQAIVEE